MNRKHTLRLAGILGFCVLLSMACALVLYALKQNINLFYTPTQLMAAHLTQEQSIRLGGYVKLHSVHYSESGQEVQFTVTDRVQNIQVHYQGVLPNLFREGQTVVVTGKLGQGPMLLATQVLAKHDEKYMPKTLANELTKRGKDHVT